MPRPELATSNPPRLFAPVGPGARNEKQDVALVQALLRGQRDRRGRYYLTSPVTGMWDRQTAAALAQFFEDQGPGVPGRPSNPASTTRSLGPRDSNLAKLARGQSLAVLKGTASVYDYKPGARGGTIGGTRSERLPPNRQHALNKIIDEISRDYGISFDVVVEGAAGVNLGVVAIFQPQSSVSPRSQAVLHFRQGDPKSIQRQAPVLFRFLSQDIKDRCQRVFKVKKASYQILQDRLACAIMDELEDALAMAERWKARFNRFDNKVAFDLFSHYLGASGDIVTFGRDEALRYKLITDAVALNHRRFEQRGLPAPRPRIFAEDTTDQSVEARRRLEGGKFAETVEDQFKVDFNTSTVSGIERYLEAGGSELFNTLAFFVGPGSSHVTSRGVFKLFADGRVTGVVTHTWTDEGYNFDAGKWFHAESVVLERHHRAKPFKWSAVWQDRVEGEVGMTNYRVAQGPLGRRHLPWLRYEVLARA